MIRTNRQMPHVNYVGDFDSESIVELRNAWDAVVPISLFTKKEFDFLQYSPTLLQAINRDYNLHFPVDENYLRHQYEGDLASLYAVNENSVRYRYYNNPGAIFSKTHKLEQLLHVGGFISRHFDEYPSNEEETRMLLSGELAANEIPVPEEIDPWNYDARDVFGIQKPRAWAYQFKRSLNSMIGRHEIKDKSVTYSEKSRHKKMGYTKDLQELLGKDIKILLFGSATDSTANNRDFDNAVLVPKLTLDLYERLEGANITQDGKPVDVVLIQQDYWEKFVRMNAYSIGILKNSVTIHGDVTFPAIDRQAATQRSISRAGGRLRMLHGTILNWGIITPEDFITREGLVTSLMKVPRYIMNSLLELKDLREGKLGILYSKAELLEKLDMIGVHQREPGDTPESIKQAFIETIIDTAIVFEEYYQPTWVHNFSGAIKKVNATDDNFQREVEEAVKVEKHLRREWNIDDLEKRAEKTGSID